MTDNPENPLRSRVTFVEVDAATVEAASNQYAPRLEVFSFDSVEQLLTASSLGTLDCEVVVLGAGLTDPVRVAQHIQRLDKNIQLVLLAAPEQQDDYRRQIEFSPFLGDAISLVPTVEMDNLKNVIGRAVKRAHRRCSYSRSTDNETAGGNSPHGGREANLYIGNVLERAPIGMLILDSDGRIQMLNRRGSEILDVRERDVLDKPFDSFFMPVDRIRLGRLLKEQDSYVGYFRIGAEDSAPCFVEITVSDFTSRSGQPGFMVILHEVTDRVAAEEARVRAAAALQASEDRFLELAEVLRLVPWEADGASQQLTYVGELAEEITGYPRSQWYEKDFWSGIIHPEDREQAIKTRQSNSRRLQNFDHRYRVVTTDGRALWIHDIVNVVRDRHGNPEKLRGVMVDVSERQQYPDHAAKRA